MTDQVDTASETNELPQLASIQLQTFEPNERDLAVGAIQNAMAICEANSLAPVYNFDPTKELETGMSITVMPLTKLVKGSGKKVTGVSIAAHPSFDLLSSTSGGLAWVKSQLNKTLLSTIRASAAKTGDDQTSIPCSVADFTTTVRTSGLAGFNAYANVFVKLLKKQAPSKMAFLTKQILKETFASAQFAHQVFPSIGQENWELALKAMIAQCDKDKVDAGMLTKWLASRNEAVEINDEDLDMEGLFDEMGEGDKAPTSPTSDAATDPVV